MPLSHSYQLTVRIQSTEIGLAENNLHDDSEMSPDRSELFVLELVMVR